MAFLLLVWGLLPSRSRLEERERDRLRERERWFRERERWFRERERWLWWWWEELARESV